MTNVFNLEKEVRVLKLENKDLKIDLEISRSEEKSFWGSRKRKYSNSYLLLMTKKRNVYK